MDIRLEQDMITINGKYANADIYLSDFSELDEASTKQITELVNCPMAEGSKIAIMPDTHAGVGCVIGFTQKIAGRIVPNLVGVDVECGMLVQKVSKDYAFDFKNLDKVIRQRVPSGCAHREKRHKFADNVDFGSLVADVNAEKLSLSVASLGSGNHFIEVDVDDSGDHYIVIHSVSRHLGLEVCKFHQKRAVEFIHRGNAKDLVERLKAEGRHSEIETEIRKATGLYRGVPDHLAWLEGEFLDDYINDMKVCAQFAHWNRAGMMQEIVDGMGIKRKDLLETFETVHNYVDTDLGIIRKGAISLQKDEMAIIPMNMRDGSLIVRGFGNENANFSGPHGAGRLMSRAVAKESLTMEEFKRSMEGIYTTCVSSATLDESPMSYKPMDRILANISELCEVERVIRPVYNFKAS